jgi:hypothetical protein
METAQVCRKCFMDTRLAPTATVTDDDSLTSIDPVGPFSMSTVLVDEQAVPDDLRPAHHLLRRLASIPHQDAPADLLERTLARCKNC